MPEPHDAVYRLFDHGVRPILAVAETPREIRRALIAYDGTMDSANAMKQFVQMGLWREIELDVVSFDKPEEEAARLLDEAVDYCAAHGHETRMHRAVGPFRRRLFPLAEELADDVVVLGNAPAGLLDRFMGGSLLWAIRHADRPLFLTH